MTDKNKAIEEFVRFTCSTETEARNYLENAGWNTEAALVTYFDDRDDRFDPASLGSCGPARNSSDRDSENDSVQADDDDFVEVENQSSETQSSPQKKSSKSDASKPYKRSSNIATLSSVRTNRDTEEEDDDDQLYYAGGSEHSGQQIMGNDRRADIAGEVFKHLKQMVSVGDVELAGPSREKKSVFSGVGYRLGQTPEDTQVVGNNSRSTTSVDERPELHLRLWRDGFSLGDEPLRPYTKKENREMIEHILRGEVPLELVPPGTTGAKVNVKVEDMRHSNYVGPTARGKFFTGPGHVLGNVVPVVVKGDSQVEKNPSVEAVESVTVPSPSPIAVDEAAPTTNIAVRLPSGTRSQVRLNLSHTVEDLRTHLTTVHTELNGQNFVFMVSFPPKEVSDEKLSISDAGLVNSSLHLRIKKD